ncbi:hypothetical protein [Streptomyces sp. NPDC056796]
MTPKFRIHDASTRDSKRKDRETTLTRKHVRSVKYDAVPAVTRLAEDA